MKKIVITYSLIAAAISSVMWSIITIFMMKGEPRFENSMFIGYTAMVISFLMIYFAMVSYRDNVGNGYISFGRAVSIGLFITAICGVFYVITWAILYNTMVPDFMEKYSAYEIQNMKKSGASPEKIAKYVEETAVWQERYKNPFWFFIMTFMEPLPVGIIITFISAFIVRMKKKQQKVAAG